MTTPIVTVTICTYNGDRFLAATLESVLKQTLSDLEVVIVDDGSKDGTVALIKRYLQQDSRIRLFERENSGLPASRNFAFSQARGEWIAIIDQDDLCYPTRLARQLEVASKHPTAGLVFCDTDHIDEHNVVVGSHLHSYSLPDSFIPKGFAGNLLIQQGCYVDSEACFLRHSTVKSLGLLDESLRYACDYDFFIRAGLNFDFAYTREKLSAWRIHPNQESATNRDRFKEYRLVQKRYLLNSSVDLLTRAHIVANLARSAAGEKYRAIKDGLNQLRRDT